ncbi:hypothetical protein Tco_0127507 [Tanacetum coccineum]
MTTTAAQQVSLDNALVLLEKQVEIGKCNMRIDPTKTQKEPTYQVVLDALALTTCYPAFLITADICPRLSNQDFDELPSDEEIVSFIKELGHKGNIKSITVMKMRNSHAYKTYLAYATRATTPKKARKFKKPATPSKKRTRVIVEVEEPEPAKRRHQLQLIKIKGIDFLSNVAALEAAQLKKVIKRSKHDTSIHQAGGSGNGTGSKPGVLGEPKGKSIDTNEGSGLKPRVPDVSKADSFKSKYESWGDSGDEANVQGNDKDVHDSDDDPQQADDERTDFENQEINDDQEESDDEFVHTPPNYVPTDDEMNDESNDVDEEEYDRIEKELYGDVNVRLADVEQVDEGEEDANMTHVAHVQVEHTQEQTTGIQEESGPEMASVQGQYVVQATTTTTPAIQNATTEYTPDPKEPPVDPNISNPAPENHTHDHTSENASENASGDPVMQFIVHNFEEINVMYLSFLSKRKEVNPTSIIKNDDHPILEPWQSDSGGQPEEVIQQIPKDATLAESDVDDSLVNDRFKTGEGFHGVPSPYTGNYMRSRPDLSFAGLDDSIYKTKVSETKTSISKTSKDIVEKPKTVRPNAPIIEEWDTDSDNDSVFRPKSDQTKPKFTKINFVKSGKNVKSVNKEKKTLMASRVSPGKVKGPRGHIQPRVNNVTTAGPKAVVSAAVGNGENVVKHMTGNKSFLTDYQEIDGGFAAFGGSPKGVMCDKKNSVLFTETECLVLSPDFKLLDEVMDVGQDWLFDIDLLTNSMNYEPVTAGNQTNKKCWYQDAVADDAGKKTNEDQQKKMTKVVKKEAYIGFSMQNHFFVPNFTKPLEMNLGH